MQAATLATVYPFAFWTHIALVVTSVGLFAARGLGVLMRQAWPMRAGWRRLSMGIDSALLCAGGTLWFLLQLNPLRDTWLGTKLVFLVVYIALGTMALKRAPTRAGQALCFLAALACVAFMASVALHHDPLGWWAR